VGAAAKTVGDRQGPRARVPTFPSSNLFPPVVVWRSGQRQEGSNAEDCVKSVRDGAVLLLVVAASALALRLQVGNIIVTADGGFSPTTPFKTVATIPEIAGGDGTPIYGRLSIGKTWRYKGKMLSYANASCPDRHLQAKGQFKFKDGSLLKGTFLRACKGTG
jgi:hypothetical protein